MTDSPQDQPSQQPQQPSYGQQGPYPGGPPTPPMSSPGPAYGYHAQPPVSPSDARMWSMFAHLGGLLLSFLVPLVIYLVYKDRDPFIRRHAAQALNFNIIIYIVVLVSIPLMFVLIGFVTATAAGVCYLIFTIMAAVAANSGQEFTYPLTPKMIS